MKNKTMAFFLLAGLGGFLLSQFLNSVITEEKNIQVTEVGKQYVCPMHSHIVSDHEGTCPICGMDLVVTQIEKTSADEKYPAIKIKPTIAYNLGVRTKKVVRGDLPHTIETIGKITRVDPSARSRIVSPMYGDLVDMVDKYAGDNVAQGEFLFSVASEKLFALEKEYQQAYTSGDMAYSNELMTKLTKMGINAEQLAQLQKGIKPELPSETYAVEDGFIFTRRGKSGDPVTSSFTVFNLSGSYQVIEVTVEIFERQWSFIQEEQLVSMQLRNFPGKSFKGTVERVDEPVGYTTRTLEARLKFKTDFKGLTQSAFARVVIHGKTKHNVLTVPRDAVIRTAIDNRIVKLNSDGRYQPVVVEIGEESNGKIEILSGVDEGDEVIVSGQFLIDSESNILSDLRRLSTNQTSVEPLVNNSLGHTR